MATLSHCEDIIVCRYYCFGMSRYSIPPGAILRESLPDDAPEKIIESCETARMTLLPWDPKLAILVPRPEIEGRSIGHLVHQYFERVAGVLNVEHGKCITERVPIRTYQAFLVFVRILLVHGPKTL